MEWIDELTKTRIKQLKRQYPEKFQKDERRAFLLQKYRKTFAKAYGKSRLYIENTVHEILLIMRDRDMLDMSKPNSIATAMFLDGLIYERTKVLVDFQNKCFFKRQPAPEGMNKMTPQMVQNAREYPIEQLIDIRHGKAKCPFHDDKVPSMQYYRHNNRVHCFSCNKSWDPIQLIMDREGINFVAAVRRLA